MRRIFKPEEVLKLQNQVSLGEITFYDLVDQLNEKAFAAMPKYPEILIKSLGEAHSIGQLKEKIKDYPDDTPFGFLNQPIQALEERILGGETFVCFQEPKP